MKILAECYANKCFADELCRLLRETLEEDFDVIHKQVYGRDRILSETKRLEKPVLLIIDYEEGISRSFVKSFFERLEGLNNESKVLIGVGRRGVVGVIFDPRFEDALASITHRDLNQPRSLKLKGAKAQQVARKLVKRREVKELLSKLVERLAIEIEHLKAELGS